VIVFDLDGTLIDTTELIRRSYRDAGVEPSPDFMRFPYRKWLTRADADMIHAAKDAAYLGRLASDPLWPLPPWEAAEILHKVGQTVALITGAPDGTIQVLAKRAPSWPFAMTCAGLSPSKKTAWLAANGTGVYVDDQEYVTMPDGWRLVQYVGQDAQELIRQVR